MVCYECKKCSNYKVCENGCHGSEKPCEFLEINKHDLKETLESTKRNIY